MLKGYNIMGQSYIALATRNVIVIGIWLLLHFTTIFYKKTALIKLKNIFTFKNDQHLVNLKYSYVNKTRFKCTIYFFSAK